MPNGFSHNMAELRRARGIPQRRAAADLGISQALLSHYENGAREPGLDFVCRACSYYSVTADYLLGRSRAPESAVCAGEEELRRLIEEMRALADRAEAALEGAMP